MIRIEDLTAADTNAIEQAAALLVLGFKEHWPNAWPTHAAALSEVGDCLGSGRINRIAVDGESTVLGWVGGRRAYDGAAWELHPLVVHPHHQRKGIGRALVTDLEAQVLAQGGATIYLGSDDEDGMTSVGHIDLYPHVLQHLAQIRNLKRHPFEFYQKLGYVIVGIIPDANGPGKPDILLAKRIA
jgi:aminoglycoside 6'-N-acetyltransferase I